MRSFTEGPLRINAPSPAGFTRQRTNVLDAPPLPPDDPYLGRLVKLVPTEVLALYVTLKGAASAFLGLWGLICLLLVIFVRAMATRGKGERIQYAAIFIAAVSFVLWIYATGGNILGLEVPSSYSGMISIFVGVWTFLVPYFYKGDPPSPASAVTAIATESGS